MTSRCYLRYFSMDSVVPAMSTLLILGSTSGFLYSSLSLFCPTSRQTVSSCTPVTSQSKTYLHLSWHKKTAILRYSLAIIETCCPLLNVAWAFLLPGFFKKLQMSSTFLSVSNLRLSGLSSPCSLMSNLAASGLI